MTTHGGYYCESENEQATTESGGGDKARDLAMEACRRNRLQEGERLMREGLVLAKRGHHCDGGGGEWQQMEKLRALAMWPQSFKSTNRERERANKIQ